MARTLALLFAFAVQLPAQAPSALDAVARAMGGRERIAAVRTLVMDGVGDNYNLGQNATPTSELPRLEVDHHRRSIDFAGKRWLVDQMRTPRFPTGNVAPQRQRIGTEGAAAFNVSAEGAYTRVGGQAAVDRVNEIMHHPIGLLQAAWASGAEVTEDAPRGQQRLIRINAGGNTFAMLVDPVTSLPSRIQKISYNAMLGDVVLETELSDWRDVDGVKLPFRFTQRLDRWVLSDVREAKATLNGDVADFGVPPEMKTQPEPPPAAPVVNVEEIAPGVWYLNGGSHHSVAIEQQRSVVLVEAPQSEERTRAVIERARQLVPGKPVEMVINTHHHFDHAGGVRAAISQGLTVVTQEGNRDFYERTVFPARHSVQTDALAANPKPLRLVLVGDKYVRRDSIRTIEMYHVAGVAHAETMLVVYLPAERLLIQADLYNPPAANATAPVTFPFAAGLLQNIQSRGLQVDRVAGIHGRVVPLSDIQAAARTP